MYAERFSVDVFMNYIMLKEIWEQIEKDNDEFFGLSWFNDPAFVIKDLGDVYYI